MSRFKLKKTSSSETRCVTPVEEVSERNKLFSSSNNEDTSVSNNDPDHSEIVISKHFKKSENVDSSLSDFVDVKKVVYPVKNVEKKPKRIRNTKAKQADIRKVMKKKKSNLVEESRQFEEVCRQGGIDVNPEHLQLAIALSRSISEQTLNPDNENSQGEATTDSFQSLESDNVKKVRKTLEQFGFKVKSDPIQLKSGRSVKKKFLNSKLLNFCQEKRKQLIDEKLSIIINECIDKNCILKQNTIILTSDILNDIFSECRLWSLCTCRIVDENYYVKELFQPADKKLGKMLKNWDDIPGRPKSPKRHVFYDREIIVNSENSDIFLGSTFKNLHHFVNSKSSNDQSGSSANQLLYSNLEIDELPEVRVAEVFGNSQNQTISGNCSPDLIEIEDFSNEEVNFPCIKKVEDDDCLIFEQSYCSDVVESQNGILHYESFQDENKCLNLAEKSLNHNNDISKSICQDDDDCTIIIDDKNKQDDEKISQRCMHEKINSNNFSINLINEKSFECNVSMNLEPEFETGSGISWNNKFAPFTENNETPNLSQSNDEIILSDDEINYSMSEYKYEANTRKMLSPVLVSSPEQDEKKSTKPSSSTLVFSPQQYEKNTTNSSSSSADVSSPEQYEKNITKPSSSTVVSSPQSVSNLFASTPDNSKYVIKTENVTPLPDFNSMSTPEIRIELNKFGLRTLKRKRAIQLLEHIYDQTHPKLDDVVKRKQRKLDFCNSDPKDKKNEMQASKQTLKKAKSFTDVPIHLAFKDYLSKKAHIKEEIYNYNPLSLESLHKDLKSVGYKYSIKDLIKFLDEKCITFRTEKKNSKS